MQHLGDGQLHAYLDGQSAGERQDIERHLAECANCRARLDTERGLRDRARTILGAAGPANAAPPPFEEILRRAHGEKRRTRTPMTVVLAWAASLAVAVTAGWYARGLVFTRGAAPAAPTATELARAPTVEAQAPAQVAQAQPRAQAARAQPAGATAQAPGAATADTRRPSPTEAAAATREGRVAGAVGEQADLARARAETAEQGIAAPEPTAAKAAAVRAAAPTVHLDQVVVTGAAAAADAWTTVPRSVAEERLGGQIATIPGLPLLGHAISGTGQHTVVRTIQVLGPGTTIELYQRRAGTQARSGALAAAESTGVTSQTVDWRGYSVTGTAPVPADSLRRLLGRLSAP